MILGSNLRVHTSHRTSYIKFLATVVTEATANKPSGGEKTNTKREMEDLVTLMLTLNNKLLISISALTLSPNSGSDLNY